MLDPLGEHHFYSPPFMWGSLDIPELLTPLVLFSVILNGS
jgi:hypothetical protein